MSITEDLIDLADKHKDQPGGVKIIKAIQDCVLRLSDNKRSDNLKLNNLIREAKGLNVPDVIPEDRKPLKAIAFTAEAFAPAKAPTQPVPVADSEIKALAKEENPNKAIVFKLYSAGQKGAEAQFKDVAEFLTTIKGYGFSSKKKINSWDLAWSEFVEFFRKEMGI